MHGEVTRTDMTLDDEDLTSDEHETRVRLLHLAVSESTEPVTTRHNN